MKPVKFVFGILVLTGVLAACSDPTSPRPPDDGGEPPPSQAFVQESPASLLV